MSWPGGTASGIPNYSRPNTWNSTTPVYNASNPIPATFVSPVPYGPIPCPGIVNDGATDNTTALNACAATGKKYILPSICQGSSSTIKFVGPLLMPTNGGEFSGSGWGSKAVCPTVLQSSSTSNDGIDINCAGSSPSTCLAISLHDLNLTAPNNSTGTGIHLTGTGGDSGSTYHGDLVFLDDLFITGFAQPVYSAGFGNGVVGTIQVYATSASTGLYLVDIGSGSANSWRIGKLQASGTSLSSSTPYAYGALRFRDGEGSQAYVGDANYFVNPVAVGASSTDYASAEITFGDTETITGPLLNVSQNSKAAVHWLGFQGTYQNTTSSPFVMNGYGALTLYNPPGAVVSGTPYPLVTKTSSDDFRVIGGAFPTGGGANLGGMAQDANGEQYFAETPFTEVPDNGLLTPGPYNRLRCVVVAARAASAVDDQIVCYYRNAAGSYVQSPNLLTGMNDSLQAALNTKTEQLKAENAALQAKFSAQATQLKAENDALQARLKAENDAKERQIRQLSERVEQVQKVQQQLTSVEARLERLEKRPAAELKKANAAKNTKKRNGPAPSARPAVVAQARLSE